jgi:hypothetical protein
MPYTPDGKAVMLDGLRGSAPAATRGIVTASLHSADPGDTGASELSGSGYARQAVAFGAPAAGIITMTGTETFPVPAGTVAWAGFWSGEGTPKFLGSDQLPQAEVYAAPGEYVLSGAQLDLNL